MDVAMNGIKTLNDIAKKQMIEKVSGPRVIAIHQPQELVEADAVARLTQLFVSDVVSTYLDRDEQIIYLSQNSKTTEEDLTSLFNKLLSAQDIISIFLTNFSGTCNDSIRTNNYLNWREVKSVPLHLDAILKYLCTSLDRAQFTNLYEKLNRFKYVMENWEMLHQEGYNSYVDLAEAINTVRDSLGHLKNKLKANRNGDDLFLHELVPCTFSVDIYWFKSNITSIARLYNDIKIRDKLQLRKYKVVTCEVDKKMHAELKIIHHLLNMPLVPKIVNLGVSKLCCIGCFLMIDSYNRTYDQHINVSGTHGKQYFNWTSLSIPRSCTMWKNFSMILISFVNSRKYFTYQCRKQIGSPESSPEQYYGHVQFQVKYVSADYKK